MPQHFLLSAKARTLSLGAVLRMTDEEAERAFVRIRWAATEGKPVCPHCGCPTAMRNVKMFVEFWNFQLRWNENMKSNDPGQSFTRLSWEKLPGGTYGRTTVHFWHQ